MKLSTTIDIHITNLFLHSREMIEVFPTLESPTNIILKAHDGKAGYGDPSSVAVVSANNIDFPWDN